MRDENYPSSVDEVLDSAVRFRPAALRAVRRFARSKPWQGTLVERWQKFLRLNRDLAVVYVIEVPMLVLSGIGKGDSGMSCYVPAMHTIKLRGRLSVVTYLHEFAHARGMGERKACGWSLNLFYRCFPRSSKRLRFEGHLVRQATE